MKWTAENPPMSRVPSTVVEERMNLIKLADFTPTWFRGFFAFRLRINPSSPEHFSISWFSLHNKRIYYHGKPTFILIPGSVPDSDFCSKNKDRPQSLIRSFSFTTVLIHITRARWWVGFNKFPVRWLKREWTWLNSRISPRPDSADFSHFAYGLILLHRSIFLSVGFPFIINVFITMENLPSS